MIHKIFTIYDCKAEAYLQPFYCAARGQAIRMFTDTVNDPNTQFYRHPSDFTLFEIGEFDDSTASIVMYQSKLSLGLALEFKALIEA